LEYTTLAGPAPPEIRRLLWCSENRQNIAEITPHQAAFPLGSAPDRQLSGKNHPSLTRNPIAFGAGNQAFSRQMHGMGEPGNCGIVAARCPVSGLWPDWRVAVESYAIFRENLPIF
jgi:hypothetical protein